MAILVVTPRRFLDERGWFSETYNTRKWSTLLGEVSFVQDNESYSRQVGTVRGLHYQRPPFAQAKVVRCMRGSILDVAVDLLAAVALLLHGPLDVLAQQLHLLGHLRHLLRAARLLASGLVEWLVKGLAPRSRVAELSGW
jgi:hypothetical protein